MSERLADIETMIEFVRKYTPCINGETTMECVERSIRNVPTIEAKPVVHAHWDEASGGRIICSHCGEYPLYDYWGRIKLSRCCHTCGAQMDEPISRTHENGVKIPVISVEDVPKIMEEMEK